MSAPATVLVLGCGLVAPPLIHYLHEHGLKLIVANRTVSKAEAVIASLPNARAVEFDCDAENAGDKLEELTPQADLVVSLLPYIHHVKAAKIAIKHKKHFCTTSYVSEEMRQLDEEAKAAGVILLNECGVDPGLDHMSAKKVIDEVHRHGGKIRSFISLCGGLPAPQDNDNPWGYKLSWSPRGVLLASRNQATFLKQGQRVVVPGPSLYDEGVYQVEQVGEAGTLEWYPNRDSTAYVPIYNIPEVQTIVRGTYRNRGWCRTMKYVSANGFTGTDVVEIAGLTLADFTRKVLGDESKDSIKTVTARKFQLSESDPVISKFEWLGLFSDSLRVPADVKTALDALCFLFQRALVYQPGEKDMIAMRHTFEVEYSKAHREALQSTLIDYGLQPAGFSSMARTVTLPVAVAIRAILDGRLRALGLLRPVEQSVYDLVLAEMEQLNVNFKEERLGQLIWLRHETKPGEERVAVVPQDAAKLVQAGFRVVVERSPTRCVPDAEYEAVGCTLAPTNSWVTAPASAIILGLKELPESKEALTHRHVFFAHCYKNQAGWKEILQRFIDGNGLLWDLEFLADENGRRVAAFGRPAGLVGMALGLLNWAYQALGVKMGKLSSWKTTQALVDEVKSAIERAVSEKKREAPTALVIGALGRCGGGAVWFADQVGVKTVKWDLAETKVGGPFPQLLDVDVLVNCIYLGNEKIVPFLTKEMLEAKPDRKLTVFADVSCDATNPNNPFPVYYGATTLDSPILTVPVTGGSDLDVIAIDHLPSLVPLDSSQDFSGALAPHLLALAEPKQNAVWNRAEKLFEDKCAAALQP